MKYIFIVNPNSGSKALKAELLTKLESYQGNLDYELYYTKGKNDAYNYVNNYANKYSDDVVFIACGGDGTLNEVVNGAISHKNAIVSCYPCGSGNDFVKIYGKESFLNINNLINGEEIKIDVMQVNDKYAINVTDFGFDANVCNIANKIRRKKLIGGKHSYTSGIIVSLFNGRKTNCRIEVDGEVIIDKNILLATVANGKYVGGAYMCAPKSINDDGILEVCIVKPISIFKFIKLIGSYKKGLHIDSPKFKSFLIYKRAKEVVISANDDFKICLDGEVYQGPSFKITNIKQGLRFLKPSKN